MKTASTRMTRGTRRGGFALLLVLAVILCLAVWTGALGLLVERGAAVAPEADAFVRARAAALVALERARERAERLAGPDLRVTAGAGRFAALDDGRRGLAGVWDVAGEEPSFLGWLADGSKEEQSDLVWPGEFPAPTGASESDTVMLVGLGSVSAARDRVVARLRREPDAPILPGTAPPGPRYEVRTTYAVFDEGVKASLCVAAEPVMPSPTEAWPDLPAASSEAALRWERATVARRAGLELLFPGLDVASPEIRFRSERLFVRSQLRLLDPAITPVRLRGHFHDVTALSRGLLTSTSPASPGWRTNWADPDAAGDATLAERLRLRVEAGEALPLRPNRMIALGPLAGGADGLGPGIVEASLWLGLVAVDTGQGVHALNLRHELRIALWNAGAVTRTVEPGELEVAWEGLPGVRITAASGESVVDEATPPVARVRAVNRLRVVWAPGEVVLLRGGRDLALDGGSNVETWAVPSPTDDEEPVWRLRLEAIPAATVSVILRVRGEGLGALRTRDGWRAVERTIHPTVADGPGVWTAAYGMSVDPLPADARVPMADAAARRAGERWTDDPAADAAMAGEFTTAQLPPVARGVRWDVPVASAASLLSLLGIINERGEGVGAPGAGAFNRVFDEVCFLPRAAAADPASAGAATRSFPYLERRVRTDAADLGSTAAGAEVWWVRGAFNVNATSVPAWSALLRGALDVTGLPGWAGLRTPRHGEGESVLDIEIQDRASVLAAAVVARSRSRARPFRSVADFVDSGVLEDAIADAGLNDALPAERRGSPGWIDQADLLCRLGPRLTARSDTFLVRVYADVQDVRTGRVLARAWAEATLQRYAEALETTAVSDQDGNPREGPPADLRARRVKMIDFRWLLPGEV